MALNNDPEKQPLPAMRMVEVIPFEHEGAPMIELSDPEGLLAEPVAVPMEVALVMSLLDGRRTRSDVQRELARVSGGHIMPLEQIDMLVAQMDQRFLLVNERTIQRLREIEAAYESLPVRPMSCAGGSYPAEEAACREAMAGYFEGLEGGGRARQPKGLMVPHIDFRVGGRSIAQGLAALDPTRPGPLYIVLGVAHRPARNLFTLDEKPMQTPLGLVDVDRLAAARLRQLYGAQRLSGSIVHQREHSVEFQAVALKHFHRDAGEFKFLPILCGSLHEALQRPGSPAELPEVGEFIAALRTLIEERNGRVVIIASVDLSHVGRKFGEESGIDDFRAGLVRAADARMLECILKRDAEGFFDHFREDGNARNVDAVTAVYVMLKALEGGGAAHAQQLDYGQWREQETDSMVTFASVAIF